jgi:hypothetical protein
MRSTRGRLTAEPSQRRSLLNVDRRVKRLVDWW